MSSSHSQAVRRSLQLSIDPSLYDPHQSSISPDSLSPTSTLAQSTTGTTPTSGDSDVAMFSVLCLHDFQSDDPDHLSFRKNEILDIVKEEDSGWWAAMRQGVFQVGWIPGAFVERLTDDMAERLRGVTEALRVYEYNAEILYDTAPVSNVSRLYDPSPEQSPSPYYVDDWHGGIRPGRTKLPVLQVDVNVARDLSRIAQSTAEDNLRHITDRPLPPPSPSTPMPHPPLLSAPAVNKPTPPTPTDGIIEVANDSRQRSNSTPYGKFRNQRRQPVRVDDSAQLARLSTMLETTALPDLGSPESTTTFASLVKTADKIKQLTGSEEAIAFHNAIRLQASLPLYLRPSFADQLYFDKDGHIKKGTLNALVERLASDFYIRGGKEETTFRNVFLMTFRTFTTADILFAKLVDRFNMVPPDAETCDEEQIAEWDEKKRLPTQRQVLTAFTAWLEDHRLLEEEPHIAQRLTEFLRTIVSPSPLASAALLIIESIQRLTFANPIHPSPTASKRRKKSRSDQDLLKQDPQHIAEQLCLLEHKLYAKISPQELLTYTKSSNANGVNVENVAAFCATHDKLVAWVKTSILDTPHVGKRAGTVDFWIKVAEKCKNLNNFASLSALINALTSAVISRLHLTLAHVRRKSHLDVLAKHNEPTGGFGGYRQLLAAAAAKPDTPCVPFFGMYLTDLVHIGDQFHDEVVQTTLGRETLVCFTKRQRWFEAISQMLRFQTRPYNIAESDATQQLVATQFTQGALKDQAWFWKKSQDVQQSELAHADIRKGLEAAGF
ncbi:hypothetical protein HGRIS_008457 [Hohenbuehelia grisea]|uniref:Ras GEF n=1 Tax=Hohenbuehelia grisea TaxID=104357 RepID=A0ABR3J865_9AGAR